MGVAISSGFGRVRIVRVGSRGKMEVFEMNRTDFGRILREGLNSGMYTFDLHPKSNLRNVHPRGWVHGHGRRSR